MTFQQPPLFSPCFYCRSWSVKFSTLYFLFVAERPFISLSSLFFVFCCFVVLNWLDFACVIMSCGIPNYWPVTSSLTHNSPPHYLHGGTHVTGTLSFLYNDIEPQLFATSFLECCHQNCLSGLPLFEPQTRFHCDNPAHPRWI